MWLVVLTVGCGGQVVNLHGTGVVPPTPQISITPSSIEFGNVNLNTQSTQSVSVNSTGTANLQITAITLAGPYFTLTAPTLPLTLTPGQQASISVTFDPTSAGSDSGTLSIISNATSSSVASVSITGVANTVSYSVNLSWFAPTSSADPIVGYNVYRGVTASGVYERLNAAVITSSTAYTDSSVAQGVWDYIVRSVDAQGNESLPSNVFTATIP